MYTTVKPIKGLFPSLCQRVGPDWNVSGSAKLSGWTVGLYTARSWRISLWGTTRGSGPLSDVSPRGRRIKAPPADIQSHTWAAEQHRPAPPAIIFHWLWRASKLSAPLRVQTTHRRRSGFHSCFQAAAILRKIHTCGGRWQLGPAALSTTLLTAHTIDSKAVIMELMPGGHCWRKYSLD